MRWQPCTSFPALVKTESSTVLMSAAAAALDSNFFAHGEKRSAPPACSSSSLPAGLSLSISRKKRSGPCQNGPLLIAIRSADNDPDSTPPHCQPVRRKRRREDLPCSTLRPATASSSEAASVGRGGRNHSPLRSCASPRGGRGDGGITLCSIYFRNKQFLTQ